jgi:hypothetical protein
MERWVLDFHYFSIRLHHWFKSDDDLYKHDHAWWFYTWVISGSYTDVGSNGTVFRPRWSLAYWPALHRHTVVVDEPCWTICLCGPEEREFGFWVKDKFVKAKKYFYKYGHHPCEKGGDRKRTFDR